MVIKEYLTTGQAAKICKCSQQTIIRCFDDGKLKGYRVPGSRFRRIPKENLFAFIREFGLPTDALEINASNTNNVSSTGNANSKRKVLVVDDDPDLAELIVSVLEADRRFETRVATNGFEAGMMVKEYRPDVIVLDVMLPDINGKEVCIRVRNDATLEKVKIICISGMVERNKMKELKDVGADDFLQKPFETDVLLSRICRLLGVEAIAA